ncbi:MAG: ABC transporter permease [Azospirillaceae bacterium]|nr:ABC transporter permease [Azospirillaceae bacterium]
MTHPLPPMPREFGPVNWIGLWTVYRREVRRFLKVHTQTILAPVITTLLFFAVFALALGGAQQQIAGKPFLEFLAPGLIVMAIAQNAFANTSSSVIIAKVQGNIVDLLMPPLTAGELGVGLVLGGVTRGIVVGLATTAVIALFTPIHIIDPSLIVYHGVMASVMMSLLGVIGAIWSEKFDHIAAVTNFIITPLTFLSGTFYSINRLPPTFQVLARLDPFFYMIDGFRCGFIGTADSDIGVGVVVMLVVTLALGWLCHWMIATGYKLKP